MQNLNHCSNNYLPEHIAETTVTLISIQEYYYKHLNANQGFDNHRVYLLLGNYHLFYFVKDRKFLVR